MSQQRTVALLNRNEVRSFASQRWSYLNNIFEAFVATMIAEAYAGTEWRMTMGKKHGSVIKRLDTNKTYSNINPDIVMSDDRELLPYDCKYKLCENKKLSTSDIYQTFLYAYSLGDPGNPRAGIIYPSSKPGIQPPARCFTS